VPNFRFSPILMATILTILILLLSWTVAGVLMLLFVSVLLAIYLNALADNLHRHLRVPLRLAFPAAMLGSLGLLVGLFSILLPPVVEQTQALLKGLPQYLTTWGAWFDHTVSSFPGLGRLVRPTQNNVIAAMYDQLANQVENLLPKVVAGVQVAIDVFAVSVMALYMAIRPETYIGLFVTFFPPKRRDFVRSVMHELGETLRAYIAGQLLTMAVLGTLTAILLTLLSVPYALTFGVFTGLVAIVPFFGSLLSTTLPALFVLNTPNGGVRALMVLGVGVIVHLVEGNIVAPLVMSKQVDLPPVLTILGVLVIGKILGPLGLLIALPTICVLMVLMNRIVIHGIYEGSFERKAERRASVEILVSRH
jgi:predicted PurR-regulated permease PerM